MRLRELLENKQINESIIDEIYNYFTKHDEVAEQASQNMIKILIFLRDETYSTRQAIKNINNIQKYIHTLTGLIRKYIDNEEILSDFNELLKLTNDLYMEKDSNKIKQKVLQNYNQMVSIIKDIPIHISRIIDGLNKQKLSHQVGIKAKDMWDEHIRVAREQSPRDRDRSKQEDKIDNEQDKEIKVDIVDELMNDTVSVMVNMGYKSKDVTNVIQNLFQNEFKDIKDKIIGELTKEALKKMDKTNRT